MTLQSFERALKQPKQSIQTWMLLLLSLVSLLLVSGRLYAVPTMEFFAAGGNTTAQGPVLTPQVNTYSYNPNNPTDNAVVGAFPATTITYTLENQQYTSGTLANNGLFFGDSFAPQNIYIPLSGQGSPANTDFSSSRLNPANPQGIDINANHGQRMALNTSRINGVLPRNTSTVNGGLGHYFGDIVLTWNRPVLNPVVNVSGLGGRGGGAPQMGFSAQFELSNPPAGTTMSLLSGRNTAVTGLTIRNNAATIGATAAAGGASGSIQILNSSPITSLRFRIYVRSDSTSTSTDWGANTGDAFLFSSSSVDAVVGDLFVSKTNNVTSVTSGGSTTYTVRVTNNGPSTIDGAILNDVVGTGLSATSAVCSAAASNRCTTAPNLASLVGAGVTLPSLASGQFYEVNVTANVSGSGSVTNSAQIRLPASNIASNTGASCVTSGGITRSFNTTTGACTSTDTDTIFVPSPPLQCASNLYTLQGDATNGFRNIRTMQPDGTLGTVITEVPLNGGGITNPENNPGLAINPDGTKVFVTTPQSTLRVYDVVTNTWVANVAIPSGIGAIRAAVTSNGIGYLSSEDRLWTFQTSAPYSVTGPVTITSINGGPSPTASNGDFFSDSNGNLFLLANPTASGTTLNLYRIAANGNSLYLGTVTSPNGQYGGYAAIPSGIYASSVTGIVLRADLSTFVATQTAAANSARGSSDLASCFYPNLNPVIQALKTSTKVAGSAGAEVRPGDTLEYRIVIRNIGTVPAADVRFQDSIPAGTTYVAGSTTYNYTTASGKPQVALADVGGVMPFVTARTIESPAPNPSNGILLVDQTGAGTMALNEAERDREVVITFRVTVNASATSVSNQGTVSYISDPGPPTTTPLVTDDPNTPVPNDATTTTILRDTDLQITKTNGVTTVNPAGTTAYTIVVTNAGPSPANGALFGDLAATGLSKTSITCTASGGAVCPTAPIDIAVVEGGSGLAIPTLPSGGSVTFTVNANVTAATGSVTNTATITAPAGVTEVNAANNSASDTDTVTVVVDPGGVDTDQCAASNTVNVITPTSDARFENATTITNIIPVSAINSAQTYFGTGPQGRLQVVAQLGWSQGNPTSSRTSSTLSIEINGTRYALLTTRPSGEGTASLNGTITAANGATISINGGAFASSVTIVGGTSGTAGSVLRNVVINLPASVSAATSFQSVFVGGPGGAADDIAYNYQTINQCKNRVTLIKALGNNRASNTDQFVMSVAGQNGPATTTTTGTAATVNNGSVTLFKVRGSTVYTLSELMAAGSASPLSSYSTTYTCTNSSTGTTTVLPAANTAGQSFALTPQAGDEITCTMTNRLAADLSITKTNSVTAVDAGSTTSYTIAVTNAGPSSANGALFRDVAAAGLSKTTITCTATGGAVCPTAPISVATVEGATGIAIPTLPSGGVATFTVNANVTATGGSVTNTATVTAPAGVTEIDPANNTASDTDTVTPRADLSITKTNSVTAVDAGSTTSYTIAVTNAGPSSANGALFRDVAAAGLSKTTITCTATGGAVCPTAPISVATVEGATGIAIPTLPSGGVATFTVNANVTATGGSVTNTATVTAPAGVTEIDPANNTASDTDTVTPRADLSITKTNGVTAVDAGGTTSYTIAVTNAGPSAANGALFRDVAAAGLSKTTITCTATGGAVCPTAPISVATVEGATGIAIPTLPSGGVATFTVNANVTATGGSVTNTATVTAPAGVTEIDPANNTASDTDTVTPRADLSITKTNGVTAVNAGGTTSYTIAVTNAGPSAANGALFRDVAAAGLSKTTITCTATGGAVCPTAPINVATVEGATGIAIPTLPSGGVATFTVNANVTATGGSVTNTATVTAPAGVTEINTANNTASDTDTVVVTTVDNFCSSSQGLRFVSNSQGDVLNGRLPITGGDSTRTYTNVNGSGVDMRVSFYSDLARTIPRTVSYSSIFNAVVFNGAYGVFEFFETGTNTPAYVRGLDFNLNDFEQDVGFSTEFIRDVQIVTQSGTQILSFTSDINVVLGPGGVLDIPSPNRLNGAFSYEGADAGKWATLQLPTTPVFREVSFFINGVGVTPVGFCGSTTEQNLDRSDAPLSYGQADHPVDPAIRLGNLITVDAAIISSPNADGDGASDDGIVLPSLTQGQTATITANVFGAGGYLTAWIDWNGNGVFDAAEQVADDLQDGGGLDTNPATGIISFAVTVPANATTNQTFARFRWSTQAGVAATGIASDGEVEDYALTVLSGQVTISGRVFTDNSGTTAIATNAYNGIQDAGEIGIAGSTVELNNCAGTVVATTQTDGTGDYSFGVLLNQISAPNFCITQTNLAGYTSVSGTAGYVRATDTITVANTGVLSYTDHNFGDARLNLVLTTDGQQTTTPSGTVSYPHTLRSESVLDVGLLNTASVENPTLGWTTVLYRDNNCNGTIDAGEQPLTSAIGVLLPEQEICVVQRVNAPATASAGAQHVATLSASYTATVQDSGVLSGSSNTRTDTTLVGTAGLDMRKQVRVVASCPSTGADVAVFTDRNTAKNGDFLEYEIIYTNRSTRNLSEVRVRDFVPSNALFKAASCQSTPAGSSCAVNSQPAVDTSGEVSWLIDGPVTPAATGSVRFCVQVPPLAEPPIQ